LSVPDEGYSNLSTLRYLMKVIPIFRLWAYLMNVIPETCSMHWIRYLCFYYIQK
jgi:hypothetical protein